MSQLSHPLTPCSCVLDCLTGHIYTACSLDPVSYSMVVTKVFLKDNSDLKTSNSFIDLILTKWLHNRKLPGFTLQVFQDFLPKIDSENKSGGIFLVANKHCHWEMNSSSIRPVRTDRRWHLPHIHVTTCSDAFTVVLLFFALFIGCLTLDHLNSKNSSYTEVKTQLQQMELIFQNIWTKTLAVKCETREKVRLFHLLMISHLNLI